MFFIKKISLLAIAFATGSAFAGGGVPASPGKLVQSIELGKSFHYQQRISTAYLQTGTLRDAEVAAVNKFLEDDLDEIEKDIRDSTTHIFRSLEFHPRFSQISALNFLNTVAIQLTKFDQDRFDSAIFSFLTELGVPVRIFLKSLIRDFNQDLVFGGTPQTMDQLLKDIKDEKLQFTGNARVDVRVKNDNCHATLFLNLSISKDLTSASFSFPVLLDKAPEIQKYCDL